MLEWELSLLPHVGDEVDDHDGIIHLHSWPPAIEDKLGILDLSWRQILRPVLEVYSTV